MMLCFWVPVEEHWIIRISEAVSVRGHLLLKFVPYGKTNSTQLAMRNNGTNTVHNE